MNKQHKVTVKKILLPQILNQELKIEDKQRIEKVVKKIVKEYGLALRLLGRE